MNTAGAERKPIAEMSILLVGALLFAVASLLEHDALFVASIFVCIFAGIAALFCAKLSTRTMRTKLLVTVVGLVATGFGAVWLATHASSAEIFSPAFIGYVGGGLALSGVINMVTHPRQDSKSA